MAIQRLSLKDIEDAILQATGYSSSTTAPWKSSATLYTRINEYMQRLAMRLNQIAVELSQAGQINPADLPLHFDCWKTTADSGTATTEGPQVAATTATFYLPADYDHYISFYDLTVKRPIPVIERVDKYFIESLVTAAPGPARAIEIGGFSGASGTWRRNGTIYPTPDGTPSFRLTYWRIPATMLTSAANTEYPDIDPKYESLAIYGPIVDLARSTGFEFDRFAALEKELLVEMCMTARSV